MSLSVNNDEKNSAVNLVVKSVLGFIPAGHVLAEFIDFRGRVQQERLSKFSEYLKEGFESVTEKPFNPEDLKTIEFLDAFEAVMRKVAATSSEEKLKYYRNILLRKMYEKNESEMFFKYLALVEEITETQILILSTFQFVNMGANHSEIISGLANIHSADYLTHKLKHEDEHLLSNGKAVAESEIEFFIHDLITRGIIEDVDKNVIKQAVHGSMSPVRYNLSPIGKAFLDFIKEYGKD